MAKVIEGGSNTTEKRMKDLAEAIAKNALKNAQEAKKVEKSVNAPPAAVSKTVQDSAQSLNRAVTKAVAQASITPAERIGVKAVTTGVKAGLDGWADGLKKFGTENAAALGLDTTSGGYFSRSFLDTDATAYLDKINSILKKQYNNSPERREAIYNLTEAEKMVTFTKRQVDLQSAVYTREPSEANKLILEKGKVEHQAAIAARFVAQQKMNAVFEGESEYEPVTAENLDRRLGYLDRSYEKSVKYLEGSGAKIEDMQAQLAAAETELSASYSNYAQFPTQENSEKLAAAAAKYNETVAAHNEAVEKHNAHYSEFENLSNAYNQIVKAERERGMKEEAWRHSVRSYDQIGEINLELKEVSNELALAEARRQQLTSRAIKPNELNTYYTQLDSYNAQIEELTAKKALLEEEAEWSRNFYYAELPHELDFAEKSQYVSTYAPGTEKKGIDGKYLSTGFVDIIYDYINKDEVATKRKELAEAADNSDVWGMSAKVYNQMSDEEIAIFNYLYAKDTERGDAEHTSAYDYIKYLQSDLNAREREESQKYFAKVAEEHPWVTSALTVVTSPMKAFTYAMQTADLINDGKIEQSAAYNKWSYIPSTIRENVSDNWGPVGSFLYNTGMSFADSLYQVAITGGFSGGGALSKAAISLITSSGAAADKIIEAKDKGITDGRSYVLGTLTGIVEGVAEHLSLDALLGGKWSKNAVQFTLKNAAAEGGEEIGAEFFGTIADILVLKDQSEWIERINAYKEQGDSDARAVARAFGDELLELLVAGTAGAISGGAMGAIEAPAGTAQRKAYKQMGSELRKGSTEGVQRLIEKGLLLESNSDGYQLARKMKDTVDKTLKSKKVNGSYELAKNKLSDYDIGNLLALILEGNGAAAQNATAAQPVQGEPVQNAEPAQALPPTRGIMAPTPEQKGVMMPTIEDFFAQKEAAQAALPVQPEQKAAGDITASTATDTTAQATPTQTTTKELTELERSGIAAGASMETIQQAKRLSEVLGKDIVFYSKEGTSAGFENGAYSRNDGKIHINSQSANPVVQIIAHELTHSLESTGNYSSLSNFVLRHMKQSYDLQQLRAAKKALYERNGETLTDEGADKEIVAEYFEKYLLTDEDAIYKMVEQNRKLGHRIMNWLRSLLSRLRGDKDAQERAFIQRAMNIYARALDSSQGAPRFRQAGHRTNIGIHKANVAMQQRRYDEQNIEIGDLREQYASGAITEEEYDALFDQAYDVETDVNSAHSYAGTNARGADLGALKKAQEMQELNVAPETILADTGWYQGADGKWRFEYEQNREPSNTDIDGVDGEQNTGYNIQAEEGGVNYGREVDNRGVRRRKQMENSGERVAEGTGNSGIHETGSSQTRVGVHSGTGGRNVYTQDSEGREISEKWSAQLANTVVVDDDGNPLAVYHFTPEMDFQTFEKGDIGFHFGTWEQATQRGKDLKAESGRMFRAYLNIENPVWARLDLGSWLPTHSGLYLWSEGILTDEEWNEVQNLTGREYNSPASVRLREILKSKGYDGILYPNGVEGDGNSYIAFSDEQIVQTDITPVNTQYSISEDSEGRKLSKEQQKYFTNSKATDSRGRLLVLYHQTGGEFTVFDPYHKGAGTRDSGTPFGIFLKSNNADIGLHGQNQMALYANISNPLIARNREELTSQLRKLSPEYDEIVRQHKVLDIEYHDKFEAAKKALVNFITEWRKENQNVDSRAIYEVSEFNKLYEEENSVIDTWTAHADKLSLRAKNALTEALRDAGYDGVFLLNDMGSWGRSTDAYIALDSEQVKNTNNLNPTDNPDIRYSITEAAGNSETEPVGPIKLKLTGGEQADVTSTIPVKAQKKLREIERNLLAKIGASFSVPRHVQRDTLQGIVQEISTEFLKTGTVAESTIDKLFEQAYDAGIVIDEEYYNQYKHLKDFMRREGVTISQEDRNNIPDWNSFRQSAFGTLKIVNNGVPVDVRYIELQEMAPELFPDDITHPAQQLERMFDVAQSIQRTEHALSESSGDNEEEFKLYLKNDFGAAINDTLSELRLIKRYAEDRAKRTETNTPLTLEQVKAMYGRLKEARRNYEKVAAKNLLTETDEKQVGRLLRGDIELEHLDPARDNIKGIKAVYEAKQEYEGLVQSIREWNNSRKAKLREEADALLENAINWRDKRTGIQYSRETMERNIEDIVKDPELAKKIIAVYFEPVHVAVKKSNQMKEEYRARVKALNLSEKVKKGNTVSEAHAVQLLGEAEDNIRVILDSKGRIKTRDGKSLDDWRGIVQNLWANNPNLDRQKITDAVQKFRKIYDELFTQMNEARVRNGYEPVNYRSGYFPHFQPGDEGILAQFGKALGIDMSVPALPTSINGLTHTFKPGIQWFGNAQERLGFNTAYDAVEGFDRYIEGVADVIYLTDSIQKLRALARQIRYRTGDEGIRKQIDAIMADTTLQEEDRQNRIEKIHENGKFVLNKFILELEEYTNLLANKKSRHDRSMEDNINRQIYTAAQNIESRIAANMVVVNPASWLTNFIALLQGWSQLHTGVLLEGMWSTLKSYKTDDGIVGKSTFLTNRRGSDPIVKSWVQKTSEKLASPMEFIDYFTADTLVRARYQQNIKRGLSEDAAMSEADSWAARVMADRSKGAMPTLFSRKNPLAKVFTQFQLEVNNQLSYLFKDIPREAKEKGLRALTAALIKFCLGAFLYNEVYEYFIGRRPALDPLGILNDTVGDITGYELPNLVELGAGAVSGDMPSFEVERKTAYETGKALGTNIAEELPFVGSLLGGGRVPISSAIPDFDNLWKAASNNEWDSKKRISTAGKELFGPFSYLALPFGGGQIKKAVEGVWAVADGGSYTVDEEGNDILQYPVYNDTAGQIAMNTARSVIFGKTTLPTGREWVESGFKNLNAKETASYQGMTEVGVPDEEAFTLIQDLKGKEKLGEKLDVLMSSDISAEGKAMAYYSLFAIEDTERPILDDLIENDREFTAVANTLMDMRALGEETEGKAYKKREILLNADISPEAAGVIFYNVMAEDKDKQLIDKLEESGVEIGSSARTILQIKQVSKDTVPDGIPSNEKRTLIMETNLSDAQKKMLYNFTFGGPQADGSYLSSKADTIKAFEDAGLNFDQFLAAQNEYTSINAADMSASEKALDFSKWVYSQTLTVKQHELMAESFTFFAQIPQNAEKLDNLVSAGIDSDTAHELMKEIGALEPLEGAKQISDAQQCRVVVNSGLSEADQMTALSVVMNDSSYTKLKACYDTVGITPSIYVSFLEYLPHYDADASGGYKQEEVKAAIDAMSGGNGQLPAVYLTTGDKAALWQMANKGWKGKNNPYSSSIGQQVYGAMNPDKE